MPSISRAVRTAFLLALLPALALADGRPAGMIINATIHTMDPGQPAAEALAWGADGRILAVGDSAEIIRSFPDVVALDLNQKVIIPGLIDAHAHIMNLGLARLQADLTGASSVEEIIERLSLHAESLPEGSWLTGRGWDQTRWPEAEFPSAADLDEAFPDRPVWLVRIDGHAAWANSAAIARSGRDLEGDWQPRGGHIFRDDAGRPNGIFIDTAMELISAEIPEPSEADLETALDLALEQMVRRGLTGIHEAGTSLATLRRYLHRDAVGRLPVRIYAMADGDGELLESLCRLGQVHSTSGRVVARSVKLYADGALGSRGAALLEEYADDPGNRGLLFERDEDLQGMVGRAMDCGLQLGIHAIGDAANRQALNALIKGHQRFPDNPGRHRIEHLQVIHPDDITRLAEHEIIASMQPTHATSDMRWAEQRLGTERLAGAYAWRRVLAAGARLALGSDFPVEPVNPMLGIHAAVTRQNLDGEPEGGWLPEERLDVMEALSGFTRDAAFAAFAEDQVGSLEAGKRADFLILSADPAKVDPAEIPRIRVLTTVLEGEPVYRHADSPL